MRPPPANKARENHFAVGNREGATERQQENRRRHEEHEAARAIRVAIV